MFAGQALECPRSGQETRKTVWALAPCRLCVPVMRPATAARAEWSLLSTEYLPCEARNGAGTTGQVPRSPKDTDTACSERAISQLHGLGGLQLMVNYAGTWVS